MFSAIRNKLYASKRDVCFQKREARVDKN